MPVCSNCGGNDFVWAENLKTGTIGRGTLSLRSGGELALGTRVCRGCGHADLFVKDPTVLRQPHTWRPGEFVPMPPRAPAAPARHEQPMRPPSPAPLPPAPEPTPSPAAPVPAPGPAAVPPPPPPAPTVPPPEPMAPRPTEPTPAGEASASDGGRAASTKRPTRRKAAKGKSGDRTILQE